MIYLFLACESIRIVWFSKCYPFTNDILSLPRYTTMLVYWSRKIICTFFLQFQISILCDDCSPLQLHAWSLGVTQRGCNVSPHETVDVQKWWKSRNRKEKTEDAEDIERYKSECWKIAGRERKKKEKKKQSWIFAWYTFPCHEYDALIDASQILTHSILKKTY